MMIKKDGITFEKPMSSDYYKVIQATPNQQGKVTIPTTVNGKLVKQIAAGSFCGMTRLFYVEMPDCIEVIDKTAFNNCQNLKSVTIYKTDYASKVIEINNQAFAHCYQLESFTSTVPLFLYEEAFYKCRKLKNLNTTVAYCSFRTFGQCKELTTIAFDNHAQWVGSSFIDCEKLTTIIFNGCIGTSTLKTESSLAAIKDMLIICNRNFSNLDLAYQGFKIKIV